MIEHVNTVMLARIQFAFTISFHIIFPAFTIGLASWLAVVEWRYLKTGKEVYQEICHLLKNNSNGCGLSASGWVDWRWF